ncbi:unnamed protein product [Adineta steineri]|uniref:Uncharacterized protein n=1 Tax=Adineta steineri TaxID=433720 RepID=A0A813RQZ4_9BILA|nr:unnamed protein product [Adineta steineri]CAF0940099.1 unnamed protein product [Adineta steineri]
MPLCLYCLSCQEVCCVACLSVDIHKEHSDQVKSVVDVADEDRKILTEHLEKIQKLKITYADEQNELLQALRNIDFDEADNDQAIDREFDRIIACTEARRKVLKKQLQKKSKICRDSIYLKQEDLENLIAKLNRYSDEGQHVLTLNDFNALSQSKVIIKKMKILEMKNIEFCQQRELSNSVLFHISSQMLLDMMNIMGSIGVPPAPLFIEQKCKSHLTRLDIEWESVDYDPPVFTYVLELAQSDNNFIEVYRGLKTKYHLHDMQPNTLYLLRLHASNGGEIKNTSILEMKTLNIDLNNWTLSMSSVYPTAKAENTHASLLDNQFTTGAATDIGAAWIKATFPHPVPINSVTIAPLHKDPHLWGETNGDSGSLQYSHDNGTWTTVGTIEYVPMHHQKIIVGGITAQYWRLSHEGYLGTSSFIFH